MTDDGDEDDVEEKPQGYTMIQNSADEEEEEEEG